MSAMGHALVTKWFPWVLVAHVMVVAIGFWTEIWMIVPFCLWTPTRLLQIPGFIIWLALTLSPLWGLVALEFKKLRALAVGLAIATPLYFILVWSLVFLEITACDAP